MSTSLTYSMMQLESENLDVRFSLGLAVDTFPSGSGFSSHSIHRLIGERVCNAQGTKCTISGAPITLELRLTT